MVQGWIRSEVAPIPAADHLPIICNYLHSTGEIKRMMVDTHMHTHTFLKMLQRYENTPFTILFSSGFGINTSFVLL